MFIIVTVATSGIGLESWLKHVWAERLRGGGEGWGKGVMCNHSYAMFVHSIWMAWVLSFLVAHQPFRGDIKSRYCEMWLVYLYFRRCTIWLLLAKFICFVWNHCKSFFSPSHVCVVKLSLLGGCIFLCTLANWKQDLCFFKPSGLFVSKPSWQTLWLRCASEWTSAVSCCSVWCTRRATQDHIA